MKKMMSIVKWFSFSKKLSGGRSALCVVLTLAPLGWLPSAGGLHFVKGVWSYVFFVAVYSIAILALHLLIGNRLAHKNVTTSTLSTIVCVALLMIQNGIIIYLYSSRILVSKSSLCLTIPASLLIAFICTEFCVQISNKNKKKTVDLKGINSMKTNES
jgi:hypothetical protein